MNQTAIPNSEISGQVRLARIAPPIVSIALLVTIGPIIAQAVNSAAIILFELGHVSSLAVKIFCNN
jgi:hypothetical protein